jgi:hypothetical protein
MSELKDLCTSMETRVINLKTQLQAFLNEEGKEKLEEFQQAYRTFCEYRQLYYEEQDKNETT